ncbi:putative E3 ubiquitin ligase [Trachipleistophora hominis]|uniref:Putative E3 ubiquitin ligase n=1 Tax=Trachipleistophora hominis TaxID=72359 RepID=L7JVN0_TRAHO|nr:putative E3 ubiquitin ligase [Trachipleistophora hominis]
MNIKDIEKRTFFLIDQIVADLNDVDRKDELVALWLKYHNLVKSTCSNENQTFQIVENNRLDAKNVVDTLILDYLLRTDVHKARKFMRSASGNISEYWKMFEMKDKLVLLMDEQKYDEVLGIVEEKKKTDTITRFIFNVKSLKFMEMVHTSSTALSYLQSNFKEHSKADVLKLARILLTKQTNSRHEYVQQAKTLIPKLCTDLFNIPTFAALPIIYEIGMKSFQTLNTPEINEMLQTSCSKELPIDIALPKKYIFHSYVVCPVLKIVCDESNPPVLLECRHVISMEAVKRLNCANGCFKCPYCPVESNINNVYEIYY